MVLSFTTERLFSVFYYFQEGSVVIPVEPNAYNVKRRGCLHVAILITDKKTSAQIDRPFARRLFKHADAELTTSTPRCKCLYRTVRVVRAIIQDINMSRLRLHVRMKCVNSSLAI